MRCLVCSSVGLSLSFSLYSRSCGDLSGSSALALTCPTNRVTPISTANTPPTHAAHHLVPPSVLCAALAFTSRPRVSDFDVPIHQWREAGLNTASTIRVHKLTVLAKVEIVRRLGELAVADRVALAEALRRAFAMDQQAR